ncbi:MAG: response regulator transcription factor [Fibrobacteria bacterium]|nr:response regulator transcription factor [Fibrobacteria bacterium]
MPTRRILLIDDDPIFSTVLQHVLSREGYQVEQLADGRAATERVHSETPPPDLVVSDIMLPFLDGFQLVAIMRSNTAWERIPIVMLSAKGQESDIQHALDNGADDYLVKPFQHGELLARIRRFLR